MLIVALTDKMTPRRWWKSAALTLYLQPLEIHIGHRAFHSHGQASAYVD